MHSKESRAPAEAVGAPVSPRVKPACCPAPDPPVPGAARLGLRAHLVLLVALAPALLLGAATTWQLGKAYRRAAEIGLASTT